MAVYYSQSFAAAIAEMTRARMANGGKLRVYSGTRPVNPDTEPTSQTLLVEFDIPAPAFNAPTYDAATDRIIMTGLPVPDAQSVGAGFATWARLTDNTGTPVYDGNCGVTGSNAMFKISSTNILINSAISISSHTFIQPKG